MKLLAFISLLILGVGSAKYTSAQSGSLNGTWLPVRQELGGTPLPKMVFEKQRLIISDSTYIVSAESVDKGILKYGDGKMDIYGRDGVNKGKHFTAIYKYENDQLTICYNLHGDSYPEAFDTKTKPTLFLSAFKKQ